MKQLAWVAVLAGFVGCQQATDNTDTDTSAATAGDTSTQDSTWDDLVTLDPVKSSLDAAALPTTPESLVKMFTDEYKQSPENAFAKLLDWEIVPETNRRTVLAGMLSLAHPIDGSKTYPINPSATKLYEVADYSRQIDMTADEYNEGREVPITHVLELQMDMGPGTTSTATLDLGARDGNYFIYPES